MFKLLLVLILAATATHCSPEHFQNLADNSPQGTPGKTDSAEESTSDDGRLRYQAVVDAVMTPVCLDCHKKNLGSYERVLAKVVPGDPEKSVFYIRAKTDMPPWEEGYAPLTPEQLDVIYNWILQGALP